MMWIRNVLTLRVIGYKMTKRYSESFLKIFKTDKNGDFTDDRIVLFIFGSVIVLTVLIEGMTL